MVSTSGPGARLGWYARRLRSMSAAEVAWRTRRALGDAWEPVREGVEARRTHDPVDWDAALERFRRAEDRPVLLDRERARRIGQELPERSAALVAAAEEVLAGRVRYFAYPEARLGSPVDWHLDPVSGFRWPRSPARRIDHRTAPADPKWIWELNRLQHLPWLAEAWLLTGREEFADAALEHLDTWVEQNPVGEGIAWRGAFEVGVRAVSVLVALQGLRDAPQLTTERFARVVTVLEAGARACWRERSLHSSANNHLVGELTGLAAVALMLPDLPRSVRWREQALDLLGREAGRQVLGDGAGAEQAVGYQVFTVELLLVVMVLLRGAGSPVPPAITAAVRRSTAYLAAVVGDGDPVPRYGDDDEGFAVRLGPEPVRTVTEHLAVVAAYGGVTGSDLPDSARASMTAAWVALASLGPREERLTTGDVGATPAGLHAAEGGLVVLRRDRERTTVDVGPLGYLSLAAHGHADALALTWSVDHREVVGDPGTGSYYGHPDWRRAHRSTAAHATVVVDGTDQSRNSGPFMWSDHAQVQVLEVDVAAGVVDAQHDGYLRQGVPVLHRRRVLVDPGTPGLVVVDLLHGSGRHGFQVSWPLHPDLAAVPSGGGHVLTRAGAEVALISSAATVPLVHDQVVGDTGSQLGWWSERLEGRRPSTLLRSGGTADLAEPPPGAPGVPVVVVSVLRPVAGGGEVPAVTDLEVGIVGARVEASWLENTEKRQVSIEIHHGGTFRER